MKKLVCLILVLAVLAGVAAANLGERRVYPLRPGIKYLFTGSRDPNNFWDDVNDVYILNGMLEVLDINITGDLDINDVNIAGDLTLEGLTASRLLYLDADSNVASVADFTNWIAGTANQIIVTDPDTDGTVTLSLPQDYDTGATPTLGGIILSDDGWIGVADGNPRLLFDDTDGRAEITGVLTVSDYMSIADAAAQINIILHISKIWELTAAGDNTFRKGLSVSNQTGKTGAADYTSSATGISSTVNLNNPNTQDWTNQFGLRAITTDINTEGSTTGTITGSVGILMDASFQDSVTVTNYYGIYHDSIFVDNNKLTNSYGIYLEDFDDAQTLNYAIYTNAGTVRLGGEILGFDGAKIGDGGVTNYTQFAADGSMSQTGTARIDWTKITANGVTIRNAHGTSGDSVSDLQTAHDGNFYTLSEESGETPSMDIEVDFTGVTAFNWVQILARYEQAVTSHGITIMLEITPFNGSAWHRYDYFSDQGADLTSESHSFFVPDDSAYINSGVVKVRFVHEMSGTSSNHDLVIDVCALYQ